MPEPRFVRQGLTSQVRRRQALTISEVGRQEALTLSSEVGRRQARTLSSQVGAHKPVNPPRVRLLATAVPLILTLALAACGGKAGNANAGNSGSTSASSSSASSTSQAAPAVTGPFDVYLYYYKDYPTQAAELASIGLDALPQEFSKAQMKVHIQAISDLSTLQQTLSSDISSGVGNTAIVVCACPYVPAALTSTKGQGYPFQQTGNKQFDFYFAEIPSLAPTVVAQPFWSALNAIAGQVVAKGQGFVESELAKDFGEPASRADQTFDSLSGKPVNADVSDVQVQEVDFYPFLGWSPQSEYMTQVVTVKNTTENTVSTLSFPLLPGAADVHAGLWGSKIPPYTGKPVTLSANGEASVQTPIGPFQTVSLSVTYNVGTPTGDQWRPFTWTLPFPAQSLKVLLFTYYSSEGDSVTTTLPKMQGDSTFDIWGAQNLSAGQSISFTPFAPAHHVLPEVPTPVVP